jgi:uncharacterized protein YbjT (DUF2867 family)
MTTTDQRPVLVTGATGGQGGSAAFAGLKNGTAVRALVRNPDSDAARALSAAGAELVKGDFSDPGSLKAALSGVRAVFSMQQDGAPASEFEALLDAAVAAGVEHYIHSTVSGVRQQEARLDTNAGDMKQDYWRSKVGQERGVRNAPFKYRTYLRPSLIIDNMVLRAPFLYPRLSSQGDLLIAMAPEQKVSFISYDTIGRVAAAAFAAPELFNDAEIELADAHVSHAEIAATLAEVTGKPVTVTSVAFEQAVEMGLPPRVAHSHGWLTDVGYPARPEMLAPYRVPTLPLREWIRRHADRIEIGSRAVQSS